MSIKEIAQKYESYIIETRRKFHQYPETSFQETKTCQMICEELKEMGITPRVVCKTGVIAEIGDRSRSGKTVALRADIDGLKILEETGAEYASRNEGYMHACGHDAHIAINLTCARMLKELEHELNGSVRLIFQPSEENVNGAECMVNSGALDGVDTIYGTHVWSDIEAGKFSVEAGPRLAAADYFVVKIKGKSAHGSQPHKGIDPISAAAAVVNNVQVAIYREISALESVVVNFCQIHGGNADNIIPEEVVIGGTARTFSQEVRDRVPEIMGRVIRETAKAYGAEGTVEFRFGSAPVVNDTVCAKRAEKTIVEQYGQDTLVDFEKIMVGEDFSEYLKIVPGVFALLGVRNERIGANHPQHSCHYAMDESVLIRGAVAAVSYAMDYLMQQ